MTTDMRALVDRQRETAAVDKQAALRKAYEHQPEPMETEFADLAIHPTGHLATDADYPDFHPGGGA